MNRPLLVDTSVWVDYIKGVIDDRTDFLNNYISNNRPLLLCPVVLQEILQGIRYDADHRRVKKILLSYPMLELDPVEAAIGAADLYRNLRKKGLTIRKSNDCSIAYYAMVHFAPLLHNDEDFDLIASGSDLNIVRLR